MTFNDPVFKAFNDFRIDDMPAQADISRRMLRRLEDIDNASTAGPTAPAARAALATSVVAHAVVELETQLIELKRQLGQGFSTQSSPTSRLRLTIRMHRVVFPRPHPLFAESDTGWGHRPAGWAAAPLGSWD